MLVHFGYHLGRLGSEVVAELLLQQLGIALVHPSHGGEGFLLAVQVHAAVLAALASTHHHVDRLHNARLGGQVLLLGDFGVVFQVGSLEIHQVA